MRRRSSKDAKIRPNVVSSRPKSSGTMAPDTKKERRLSRVSTIVTDPLVDRKHDSDSTQSPENSPKGFDSNDGFVAAMESGGSNILVAIRIRPLNVREKGVNMK
eukprot:351178_1